MYFLQLSKISHEDAKYAQFNPYKTEEAFFCNDFSLKNKIRPQLAISDVLIANFLLWETKIKMP